MPNAPPPTINDHGPVFDAATDFDTSFIGSFFGGGGGAILGALGGAGGGGVSTNCFSWPVTETGCPLKHQECPPL